MLVALSLILASPLVPEAIESWRADLQREFGVRIPVLWIGARVEGDQEGFDLAARQMASESFRAQFRLMQAATITETLETGSRYLIAVNEAWRPFWQGHEAALLGHEFGHVWLRLRRLPAPAYSGSESSCIAIHTGDVVQHILIRAEMDRRGIDHRALLMKSMDESAAAMAEGARPGDSCAWVRQAALWVDARLGLKSADWPGRDNYERLGKKLFPESEAAASRIIRLVEGKDLDDRFVHRQALIDVFGELKELAARQMRGEIL